MKFVRTKDTNRGCDGLYGVALLRVKLKKTVNVFLLKEGRKRFGRLGTTVHFESDPRFSLCIEDMEKVLCRLSRRNNLSNGTTTGI